MKQILTQRDALIFFFVIFNVGLANAVISTFSVMWVTQLGGPSLLLGLMYGANCLTEVTVFWFSPQLLRKLKASKMLMIAIGAIIVRIGYYAVLPHPWAVLPAELLHGATWALMWCAAIDYAGTLVDPSVRTTMQGLLSGVYTGLGGCVGSFAGGYIQAAVGARVFFGIASGWMVLVGVFFVVAHFCQSHERLLGKLGASVDECAATVVARRPSLFETESKSRRGSMEARRSSVVVLEEVRASLFY
jgi:MFS family permease